tara:strand:- start:6498 stop:6953 length:456 start_codon:yes stop_codon:yes gene_type:complete
MNIKFIKSSGKKKILAQLSEQFGITKLPYLLIAGGKEKIRAFSGSLSKEEIFELNKLTKIEGLGTYLIKQEADKPFRLSLDATHLLSKQISKNIFTLNDQQLADWLHGLDIQVKAPNALLVLKHGSDFLGCGVSNGKKIYNYIPKERRIKN